MGIYLVFLILFSIMGLKEMFLDKRYGKAKSELITSTLIFIVLPAYLYFGLKLRNTLYLWVVIAISIGLWLHSLYIFTKQKDVFYSNKDTAFIKKWEKWRQRGGIKYYLFNTLLLICYYAVMALVTFYRFYSKNYDAIPSFIQEYLIGVIPFIFIISVFVSFVGWEVSEKRYSDFKKQ